MSSNLKLAVANRPSTVISVKWIHFSSFRIADVRLGIGQSGIRQCLDGLLQLDQAELLRIIQESICIRGKSLATIKNFPYKKIEFLHYEGPDVVGIDSKGITCKGIRIFVNVEYNDERSASEHDVLVKRRNDIIEFLDIELRLDDAIVQKTGVYDYLTYNEERNCSPPSA